MKYPGSGVPPQKDLVYSFVLMLILMPSLIKLNSYRFRSTIPALF